MLRRIPLTAWRASSSASEWTLKTRSPRIAGGAWRRTAGAAALSGVVDGAVLGCRRPDFRARRDGQEDEARAQIRLSLQSRQAALEHGGGALAGREQRERGADRQRVPRTSTIACSASLHGCSRRPLATLPPEPLPDRSNRRCSPSHGALGPAQRTGAAIDLEPASRRSIDLARAPRRIRADSDGDGTHARTRRQTGAGRLAAARRAAGSLRARSIDTQQRSQL